MQLISDTMESVRVRRLQPRGFRRVGMIVLTAVLAGTDWGRCGIARVNAAERPPNVVMIISDDQGWTDFGFMDHKVVMTPRLDKLAAESARFPNAYVPTSLCRA